VGTAAFLALAFSGSIILMSHPRLYWGEVGNDLTPAILELPISRNYKREGWEAREPISDRPDGPVSAIRKPGIFDHNGWARSLHFLAAWVLLAAGLVYVVGAVTSRHLAREVLPRGPSLRPRIVSEDLRAHLRGDVHPAPGGAHYGPLQRWAYTLVVLVALPLAIMTGLTMSPAVVAAVPVLPRLFGGTQSARTLHFAVWLGLLLFLVCHVMMVARSGFSRQLRAMTFGRSHEE
jgi:thiosulfate reductase cytochrome b subunit